MAGHQMTPVKCRPLDTYSPSQLWDIEISDKNML